MLKKGAKSRWIENEMSSIYVQKNKENCDGVEKSIEEKAKTKEKR